MWAVFANCFCETGPLGLWEIVFVKGRHIWFKTTLNCFFKLTVPIWTNMVNRPTYCPAGYLVTCIITKWFWIINSNFWNITTSSAFTSLVYKNNSPHVLCIFPYINLVTLQTSVWIWPFSALPSCLLCCWFLRRVVDLTRLFKETHPPHRERGSTRTPPPPPRWERVNEWFGGGVCWREGHSMNKNIRGRNPSISPCFILQHRHTHGAIWGH